MTEHGPGQVGELLRVAVAAAKKIDQSFIRKSREPCSKHGRLPIQPDVGAAAPAVQAKVTTINTPSKIRARTIQM
jgi:hypothetical protein